MQKIYLCPKGRKENFIKLLFFFVLLGIGGKGLAQLRTWDGSTSGAWFNPSNWVSTSIPSGTSDTALFDNNSSLTVGYAFSMAKISEQSIGSILFAANATSSRTIKNSSSTPGFLTLNATPIITNVSTANHFITDGTTASQSPFGIRLGNIINNIINTDGNGDITISCIVSGSNPLTKSGIGAGVLNLSPGNTYTGKTTIASSFINATDESAFGANPAGFVADQITLNGGGIQATVGNITFSSNRGLTLGASGGTFDVASTKTITASAIITGLGPLNITGSGTALVLMNGQHTYTGITTISGGTFQLNRPGGNTIPVTNNAVLNGGTLNITTNQTLNNLDINSGTLNIAAGVTLTINGTLTYSGGTINTTGTIVYGPAGKLIYNASKATGIEWSNSNLPSTVTLNNAAAVTLANNASTSGNLTINNTSNLTGTGFTLTVAGDWNSTSTNAGTGYSAGNNDLSTVILNGSGTRSISHTGDITFRNLNVSGTGYYTVSNNISISVNTLNISNGTLDMLTNTLNGSGNLTMSNGVLKLAKLNTTLPELNTGTYTLTGGTIELYGIGNQELRGARNYRNLTFSSSGTKTISSAISSIIGTITITNTSVLDVANSTMGGASTNITMTGTSRYITSGISTKPDAMGTYSLAPTSTIEFSNNAGTQQDIRLTPAIGTVNYGNVDITGSNVGLSGPTSSLKMQAIATFKVLSTGTFNVQNINGFAGTTTTAINNTNAPTITLIAGSTINYDGINQAITNTVAYQNLRLSGTGLKTAPSTNLLIEGNLFRAATSTFNANTGRVVFQGTAAQTFTDVTALAPIEFFNLSNTNTSNLIVNNSFAVQNELNLTPTAKLNLNSGDIVLRSTAGRTAYITDLGTTAASINITYGSGLFNIERYLSFAKSWRLLATPIVQEGLSITNSWREAGSLITTGYGTQITGPASSIGMDQTTQRGSMKWYNKITNNYVEITNTADAIARPQGYYIFVRGDRAQNVAGSGGATNLRMRGKILSGNQVFSTLAATGPTNGFESVGNPFPSQINFKTAQKSNLEPSFTVWNPTAGFYGVGRFIQYVSTTGVNGDYSNGGSVLNSIESGQAFFIQASVGAIGTLTIKESDKLTGSSLVSRTENSGRIGITVPTLEVNLHETNSSLGNTFLDHVVINFDESFSNSIDRNDVKKFMNANDNLALTNADRNLILESRKNLTSSDTIFLSITNTRMASYRFEIDPSVLGNLPLNAFLKDKFLGIETPVSLKDTTSVNFSITSDVASSLADRFMIVFRSAKPIAQAKRNFLKIAALKNADNTNNISWSYGNELDIAQYSIEHSFNGTTFVAIGNENVVNLGKDQSYSFKDAFDKTETVFYRVKATSINGEIQYSDIVKVISNVMKPLITVQPNPVRNKTIHINLKNLKGDYNLKLVSTQGTVVYSTQLSVSSVSEEKNILLGNSVAAGIYDLFLVDNAGRSVVRTVYIQ